MSANAADGTAKVAARRIEAEIVLRLVFIFSVSALLLLDSSQKGERQLRVGFERALGAPGVHVNIIFLHFRGPAYLSTVIP